MPTASSSPEPAEVLRKEPGRGAALIVYCLFLGSVMAVVTAPLGVLIAHLRRGRVAEWIDSHLRFQIRTFWLGLSGGGLGLGLWHLLGLLGLPAWLPWTFGYLLFTACLVWMVGRCGVGLHRLLANRPVADPSSLGFGGARLSLADPL